MTQKYCIYQLVKYVSLSFFVVTSISGCLIRPDVDPKLLLAPPNTFSVGNYLIEVKKVHVFQVWDYVNSDSKLLWKIESKCGVPAKNFTITVGEVPENFIQTIPDKNKKFRLIRGQKYRIMIWTDHWPGGVSPRGTIWVAE